MAGATYFLKNCDILLEKKVILFINCDILLEKKVILFIGCRLDVGRSES